MPDVTTPVDGEAQTEQTREQLWDEVLAADDGPTVTPLDAPDASDGPDTPEAPDAPVDATAQNADQIKESEQARISRLEHQLASSQGRVAKLLAAQSKLAVAQKSAPPAGQDQRPSQDAKKKLDAARAEYPDVVGPLADTVEEMQKKIDALSAMGQQTVDEQTQAINDQLDEQTAIFKAEHPDGEDFITQNAAAFKDWITSDKRPKYLHDIFEANRGAMVDGTGVSLLLSEFKIAMATANPSLIPAKDPTQQRRESQLAGAQATKQTSPKAMTGMPPADGADKEAAMKWALSVM